RQWCVRGNRSRRRWLLMIAGGIKPHRSRDVLQRPLTNVLKHELRLTGDLLVRATGQIDRTRLTLVFHTSRNVYAVAEDVIALADDVTDVDANAKLDA